MNYTLKAFPALMTPVILLGGIYSGIVTATEAGALAAVYTILISIFAYRCLTFKGFIKVLKDTVIQAGVIMAIAIAAWVMSHIVTSSGLGRIIADWFLGFTNNKYVFLLIINVVVLFLGMIFDTQVLMFVFIPLIVPIAVDMGIDMVHFGVFFR